MKPFGEISGCGQKTARQIILDLKGKLADVVPEMIDNLFNHEARIENKRLKRRLKALEALRVLGYAEKKLKSASSLKRGNGAFNRSICEKALQNY